MYAEDATVWLAGMPAEAKGKDKIRQVAQGHLTASQAFSRQSRSLSSRATGSLDPKVVGLRDPVEDVNELDDGRRVEQIDRWVGKDDSPVAG